MDTQSRAVDDAAHAWCGWVPGALAAWALAPAEFVPLLARMLAFPSDVRYPLPPLVPPKEKQRLLEAIWQLLQVMTVQAPVLLIVEDLHWVDASTLDLLTLLVQRVQTVPWYLLLVQRPEFQAPWGAPTHSTVLTLRQLGPVETAALATQVRGTQCCQRRCWSTS